MDLNSVWYLLIGLFIVVYAILDGYDLGIGFLHIFAKDENERRTNMSAIEPLWDGNEVWLIAGGGSLFAVFPLVYAAMLSAFYLLFFLLLFSLILRAISIEFRSKSASAGWRRFWDWGFGIGSLSSALMFGIMLGSILIGLPVNEQHDVVFKSVSILNAYSILIGLLVLVLFAMHGAIYMTLKADGRYLLRLKKFLPGMWVVFVVLYAVAAAYTVYTLPVMIDNLISRSLSIPLAIINMASIFYIPLANRSGRSGRAFSASAVMIASIMGLLGLGLFPEMLPSSINPIYSLNAYNASSGPYTLKVMLMIAMIFLPIMIVYAVFINRIFKGKATSGIEGYE